VAVRSGVLEMREKVIKFFHEMRNDESGEIAAVCVLTGVHIDSESRKSCPFPAAIVARGQAYVRTYDFDR
jgi:acyl-CoA thioester hydrolase